jgi:hypothetical protein
VCVGDRIPVTSHILQMRFGEGKMAPVRTMLQEAPDALPATLHSEVELQDWR